MSETEAAIILNTYREELQQHFLNGISVISEEQRESKRKQVAGLETYIRKLLTGELS